MGDFYANSSVLVKRHITEVGSGSFRALADPTTGNTIVTAQISIVEVISAPNRRVRDSTLTRTDHVAFKPILTRYAALSTGW